MRWITGMAGLMLSVPAQSQVADAWITMGVKDYTCAQWTTDKAENSWPIAIKHTWLSGVISGYNAAHGGNIADTTNGAGIFGWMDQYCAQDPLEHISAATRKLIDELAERKSR